MQKVVMGLGDSDEDEESQDVRRRESFFRTIRGFLVHLDRTTN